jgi:hypothetical protein
LWIYSPGGYDESNGLIVSAEERHVKQMCRQTIVTKIFLIMAIAVILFSAGFASAAEKLRTGEFLLLDTYHGKLARLEKNSFGLPIIVESVEQDDKVHVDVYGIFHHPFGSIAAALKVPANWCDIVSLHPNVKACSYNDQAGTLLLAFYLGQKTYQPPEDMVPVISRFRCVEHQGYQDIMLNADEGPYATKDHRMRFEALPLDGGRTFVHVSYAYRDSAALRLATKIYFATLGRGKVGFTVAGTDKNGKPDYIGGPRGALERSAVRYYFAIQSFMNTLHYPEESRFSMRISEWYDLTARFPKQLIDLDKKKYIALKTREHKNQVRLQQRIVTGLQ